MFMKYQHVEKWGNDDVFGINLGECLVFPKLDGTNASVWMEDGCIKFGSRNRVLSLEKDNAGFMLEMMGDERIEAFFGTHPNLRLYGEWLVPHSLKTYREDAWRKFYIFDVYDGEKPVHYDEYQPMLEEFDLDYIAPIARGENMTYDQFVHQLGRNDFLIEDGAGTGEGIVIKNYLFENKFGRTVWAKIVTSEFKEKHHKELGAPKIDGAKISEQQIVDEWCTGALINKTFEKIRNDGDGWNNRRIPELLSRVYHDLITEECWSFVKKMKNPAVDFGTLNALVIQKIKKELPEVFG